MNLYFAINTARWAGPSVQQSTLLRLPPERGDVGLLGALDVLEVVDEDNAIVRAWYRVGEDETFVDLWIRGMKTSGLAEQKGGRLPQEWHVTGSQLIDTTCGKRSFVVLEAKSTP